jgi:hypothetical protein
MANALTATVPTFKINGVSLPIPSTHKWELPDVWGIDGSGFERLVPFASVELVWGTMTYTDYTTLYDVYKGSISGSATANLPALYGTSFSYPLYTGVRIDVPRIEGPNMDGSNVTNVKMKIRKITIRRS